MPLETGTLISDLNASNPAATDGCVQGDDHLRLIKSTLLATFPNITAALASTAAHIDAAVTAVVSGTSALVLALGTQLLPTMAFTGDPDTGIWSPGANQLSMSTGGVTALSVKADQSVEFAGVVKADGAFTGGTGQLIPVGLPLPWLSNTLPNPGNFGWLNGQAISRSANPLLFTMWGTTYGIGDGSTTFNVPNLQEVTLIGRSTMGGASSPSRMTHLSVSTLGVVVGEEQHTLTTTEMPTHAHGVTDPGHVHSTDLQSDGGTASGTATHFAGSGSDNTGSATTGISIQNAGSGGAHNNVQPSLAINWVALFG